MIIGKIFIDVNDLTGYKEDNELEVINRYLNGNKEIETIRELIEIIADTDLGLYTEEEFFSCRLYKKCEYKSVSPEQLQEFINHKVIDPSKEVSPSYYANFLYIDGKPVDPVTGQKPSKVGIEPCLIEFSHDTWMTFYLFDWYKDYGYYIEIED